VTSLARAAAVQLPLFQESAPPSVTIRESRRARRLNLSVLPHGTVEVVVPPRTRPDEVESFVSSHQEWIERTRHAFAAMGCVNDLSPPDRIEFRLVPEIVDIHYETHAGRPRLRVDRGPPDGRLCVSTRPAAETVRRQLLRRWAVQAGSRVLLPQLQAWSTEMGLRYRDARVGRQRTRWGSCTSARRISLNCALLFLPPRLVECVMVHELCHLRHLNHSRRFWSLVGEYLPDYRQREKEIGRSWGRVPAWLFYDA